MQCWTPVESEVEIIPPKNRFRTGLRSFADRGRVDVHQKVSITERAIVQATSRHSVYDASGRMGRHMFVAPSRLKTYA